MSSSSTKPILYFLLALALARGLVYASFVPPWQAPDEPAHFERAKAALSATDWTATSRTGPYWYAELPRSMLTFAIYDFLDTPRKFYSPHDYVDRHVALYQEGYQGLYGSRSMYALIGWPLLLAGYQDITLQLYLVRLNTVLMNVGIILLAWLTVRLIFPRDKFLMAGVPALILFNPQHTHLLSTINNGNLAELLSTAAIYFMVRTVIKGFSWLNLTAVLFFMVTAMWAKATAFFLPFALGVVALFYLWQYRRHWRWALSVSLISAGALTYFAPERLRQLLGWGWQKVMAGDFYLDPIVPKDLFRSFWAMPGWTIFYIHPLWYQLIGGLCLLAIMGLILLTIQKWPMRHVEVFQPRWQAVAMLAVSCATAIGVILAWNTLTSGVISRQGRSIYPVMMPVAFLLTLGWRQFIPKQWRGAGLAGMIVVFLLFDTMVLFHYLVPFFYSRY